MMSMNSEHGPTVDQAQLQIFLEKLEILLECKMF